MVEGMHAVGSGPQMYARACVMMVDVYIMRGGCVFLLNSKRLFQD